MSASFPLLEHSILVCITGSQAYGMATPYSDVDIKGVCIPPIDILLSSHHEFSQNDNPDDLQVYLPFLSPKHQKIAKKSKLEGSIYVLKKFFKLAAAANPSIIECLYCREEELILCTDLGAELRRHRHLFLSAQARHTFQGYAISQLKRIQTHRKWLLTPPSKKPTRDDFGLPERPIPQLKEIRSHIRKQLDRWEWDLSSCNEVQRLILQDTLSAQLAEMHITEKERWARAARLLGAQEPFITILLAERQYQRSYTHWKQYQQWCKNRNPHRAKLEAKSGYDTKHAAHLVRLMRMGEEILRDGQCNIWRGDIDAQELSSIREGAWSYDKLIEWTEYTQARLDELFKKGSCPLPLKPDIDAINALCVRLHRQWLHAQ